ncbi:TetR/AcrR family transcriptional regulator [Mameliella sediminis]|uniref:TetR/AcrR family transcriptional regulator n=1 Tax=Mameliella sediminis TaxID=2836866 RepID=UPI001FEA2466|nr:TetR/AcrR family transcriptional regulator [Mameliella sediminis]
MMDASETERLRQEAILQAAMAVMCQYGFRRTSMEDIARAAGMSRPALYQHFRNKEDIARRMVEVYFETAAQDVATALTGEGSVPELLARAFRAKAGPLVQQLLESPHGAELLDQKHSHAAPEIEAGTARLTEIFAAWLQREDTAGRVTLEGAAQEVAETLLNALNGIKKPPYDRFVAERTRLAQLLGRGLAPR